MKKRKANVHEREAEALRVMLGEERRQLSELLGHETGSGMQDGGAPCDEATHLVSEIFAAYLVEGARRCTRPETHTREEIVESADYWSRVLAALVRQRVRELVKTNPALN